VCHEFGLVNSTIQMIV